MGFKESLEELIDEYESEEPFLTVGARAVLATYRRLLEQEKSGGLNSSVKQSVKGSVRSPQLPRRRTK